MRAAEPHTVRVRPLVGESPSGLHIGNAVVRPNPDGSFYAPANLIAPLLAAGWIVVVEPPAAGPTE